MRVRPADPWRALRGLRIGCVKYLNSRPLICAYDGPVIFEHPATLARMLAGGELDVALVPVFEVLRDPRYWIVDDVAVACDGPVLSVFLAYRGELCDVKSIEADPSSLSSLNLTKVMLAEFRGMHPTIGEKGDARLLIGNQAVEFRRAHEGGATWRFLDLGAEWKRCTGLPFVFAVWALHAGRSDASAIAEAFRSLKEEGVRRIPELIAHGELADEETRRRYLTEFLRFEIGPNGKAAVGRFRSLLASHGLIDDGTTPLKFV